MKKSLENRVTRRDRTRTRKRKPKPQRPPLTLPELRDELDELIVALGCVKPIAAMAQVLCGIVPSHKNPVLNTSDIIDLERSALLLATGVRIRLSRLLDSMQNTSEF